MASHAYLVSTIVMATLFVAVHAADPDALSDFVAPTGVVPDASTFTFRELRNAVLGEPIDVPFKVTKASSIEFPILQGQSVSYAVLQFAPGGSNPPHIHPRSAELLLVVQGKIRVGFVDSSNKLFTKELKAGDLFVFPKGLVHFQFNKDSKNPAIAISAFGSANAGTISLPKTLFASSIDDQVLASSFKTNKETIQKLVSANMG